MRLPAAPVAAMVTVAVALVCASPWLLVPVPVNHDVGWYVHASGQLADGARLYVDVIDVNPPLVFYLTYPSTALAAALDWPPVATFHGAVLALAAVSLLLLNRLLARVDGLRSAWPRHLCLQVFAILLIAYPGYHFGQREHLLLLTLLPYAVTVALRRSGATAPTAIALPIGILAGFGLALKPYFLLGPALLLVDALRRERGLRAALTPENLGAVAVLAGYGVHFLLLPDDVRGGFAETLELATATYGGFRTDLATLLTRPSVWLCLTLGAFVFFPSPALRRFRSTQTTFGLMLAGLLASALLQGKGWRYHYLPAEVFAWGVGTWTVLGMLRRPGETEVRGASRATGAAMIVVAACVLVTTWHTFRTRLDEQPRIAESSKLRELAAGGSIMALDSLLLPHFPLVHYAGLRWSFRYCCLWPLPGLYADVAGGAGPFPYRRREDQGPAERRIMNAVLEDLEHRQPTVVMVKRRPLGLLPPRFHVLEWLRTDPRFEAIWAHYERVGMSSEIILFRRR